MVPALVALGFAIGVPRAVAAAPPFPPLRAVSWFGAETETMAPHGLWARNYRDLLGTVRAVGFDAVRLPFSNAALRPGAKVTSVDYRKNPDLEGLAPVEVLDRVIVAAEGEGLRILLDRHRPTPRGQTELWIGDGVDEARWIGDWVFLARRYCDRPAVVGFELHNEPHGAATWGSGDPATDWRLAAERAGEAVLAACPRLWIFVQGVERTAAGAYWWGGNLSAALAAPVRLSVSDRVVYVAHDYPPSVHVQPWFGDPHFPANLPAVWERFWASPDLLAKAPVMLGEFGSRLETREDEGWLDTLVRFLAERQASFAFWSLNPNSADTGGILEDDWTTVDRRKVEALAPLLAPRPGP